MLLIPLYLVCIIQYRISKSLKIVTFQFLKNSFLMILWLSKQDSKCTYIYKYNVELLLSRLLVVFGVSSLCIYNFRLVMSVYFGSWNFAERLTHYLRSVRLIYHCQLRKKIKILKCSLYNLMIISKLVNTIGKIQINTLNFDCYTRTASLI